MRLTLFTMCIAVVARIAAGPAEAQEALFGPAQGLPGGGPPIVSPDAFGPMALASTALESLEIGEPVKGAPYSAEATTEVVQTLADGNRIVRRATGSIYRDSRGRVRREQTLALFGVTSGEPARMISITDPATGVLHILDPKLRTATRQRAPRAVLAPSDGVRPKGTPPDGVPPGPMADLVGLPPSAKTDSLASRVIEGLMAEGTRTTVTIPAGAVGNERAIEIVNERWFSPDLQIIVLSHRVDPHYGETTYRVTMIRREEPARELFEVPADYRLINQRQ